MQLTLTLTPEQLSALNRKVYLALKRFGHGAAKAAEIELDWRRGDPWARGWVRMVMEFEIDPSQRIEGDEFFNAAITLWERRT